MARLTAHRLMGRELLRQQSFNSGELSPLMAARQDQQRYANGLKRMRNFIPALEGPARKRPGTRFVAETATSSTRAWLVPFIFDQTDSWALEFGDGTLRFYTDHGQVLEAAVAISAMTNANPGVFTKAGHGLAVGQEVYIRSLPGTSGIAGRNFRVRSVPTVDTFTLEDLYQTPLNTLSVGAYSGSGTFERVYQIDTPWAASDLVDADGCFAMSFVQSNDVLDICVPGFQPRKLTRSGPTSWAFSLFEPKNGPFETVDPDQTITVYASAATGSVTLMASSSIFALTDIGSLFLIERKLTDTVDAWEPGKSITANDIRRSQGNYYKALNTDTTGTITPAHTEGARYDGDGAVQWEYQHSGYGWAKITGYTSGTQVTATVLSRIPSQAVGSGNATTRWAFGLWSETRGWPTHVAYWRERKCFIRGTRAVGSVPQDYDNFAQREAGVVRTDSAFDIDFQQGRANTVKWVASADSLLVGTPGGEIIIRRISGNDPVGPDNIEAVAGPGYGSRRVTPVLINDGLAYITTSGRTLRELRYAFDSDAYVAMNRTAFASHIAKGRILQAAYAREPESIMWCGCGNGDLIAMSIDAEHELLAWHKHPVGGSGLAESVAVIPSPSGDRHELWMITQRTINGMTKRYVSYLEDHWDPEIDASEDMFYLDEGLSYEGAASATISGLHHLEGLSVAVFGDGQDLGDFVVSNGAVTLPAPVSPAHIGLGYTATLESMNIVPPGVIARFAEVWVRFATVISATWRTVTQRERSSETGAARAFEIGPYSVDSPAPTVARLIKAQGESGHGRELTWVIESDRPVACTVAAVAPDVVASGRPS